MRTHQTKGTEFLRFIDDKEAKSIRNKKLNLQEKEKEKKKLVAGAVSAALVGPLFQPKVQ